MNVLHISESDYNGGGAIAQYRLHRGLIESGISSKMLVFDKITDDESVALIDGNVRKKFRKYNLALNMFLNRKTGFTKKHYVKFPGLGIGVINKRNYYSADIVHLGWIERGILTIADIKKIPCPVVWTAHTLWPISDGSQYYYQDGYHAFKRTEIPSVPGSFFEKFLRRYRQYSWRNRNDWVACPSKWVTSLAMTTPFFEKSRIRYIGHYIDLEYWRPINKIEARNCFGFDQHEFIICLGATNISKNIAKGYRLAVEVFEKIFSKYGNKVRFVVFGSGKQLDELNRFNVLQVGKISHKKMRVLFSAADCCLNTSTLETFCLVVQESMACGTPCVGFPVGAIHEMINHKKNGYLAKPFDSNDLVAGIEWLIEDPKRLIRLGKNARKSICEDFGKKNTIEKYIELYHDVLSTQPV